MLHFNALQSSRRLTLVFGALALVAFAYMGDAQEKMKTDSAGDALPQGAIARMGTLRWRHGEAVSFVAFTGDGKGVVTASNDNIIRLWDRQTGKEIRKFEMPGAAPLQPGARPVGFYPYGRSSARIALSNDGTMLAAILSNKIQFWDVNTGKPLREVEGTIRYTNTIASSPDDKILAARSFDRITFLYSTQTGKEIRQFKSKQAQPGGAVRILGAANGFDPIAFSADGKTIASVESIFDMQKITTSLVLSETDTGKEIRRFEAAANLGTNAIAAIAFSPNGKVLAHGAGNAIQLREPDTGKEIRSINQAGGVSALVFAPNSESLAVRGRDQSVRIFETTTGKTLHTLLTAPVVAGNPAFVAFNIGESRDIAFSSDGKTLAVGGGQALRFFTVANGKEQAAAGGGHTSAVTAVVVTPDGKTLISRGADNVIRRWDARTGEAQGQFAEPKGGIGAVFSPDGKLVALAGADGTIHLHNVADGAAVHQVRGHTNGIEALAFSSDSKLIASRGFYDGTIRVHDTAQGSLVKQITLPGANPAMAGGGAFIYRGPTASTQTLAFSADGQTLAANINATDVRVRNPGGVVQPATSSAIHLWDVATAKEIGRIILPPSRLVANIAFSPDGRILVAENSDMTLSLWELASRRERALLGTPAANQPLQPGVGGGGFAVASRNATNLATTTIAFSPDGSLIAQRHVDRSIRIWEVAHTKEIGRLTGHDGGVNAIAFARDGKSLASASADTTALLWDLARLTRSAKLEAVAPTAKEMDDLWTDLSADDAGKAWRGIQTLARAGKHTTDLVRERLKPATPPDLKKLGGWVADLDSTNFGKRTAAAIELEKLGELAVPALKQVLDSKPSPEVRRRVEPILEKLTTGVLTSEQIRAIRAIEALEQLGTAEARQVLNALGGGAPGAVTTRHAQGTLARMSGK